jgi:hypothetical protein
VNDEQTNLLWNALRPIPGAITSLEHSVWWIVIIGFAAWTWSAPDAKASLAACTVAALDHHLTEQTTLAGYLEHCMSSNGYDYLLGDANCGPFYGQTSLQCYERRGAWRSTKLKWTEFREWVTRPSVTDTH